MSLAEAKNEIKKISTELDKFGFLNAQKTILKKDTLLIVNFELNHAFKRVKINYIKDEVILDYLILHKYEVIGNQIHLGFNKTTPFLKSLTSFYEEQGDTFIQISLKNIVIQKKIITADLKILKNKPRTIDKIIFKGFEKFPKKYIDNYLIRDKKKVFNQENLKTISNQIKLLPFVEEIKKPQVLFLKDSTLIYMYLKKKKANRFNGLIGFSSKEKGKGLNLEGHLNFELNNIFNKGEEIEFLWKKNNDENKRFKIGLKTPFIFNSSFAPKLNFEIFSQDSTFINISSNMNVNYIINSKSDFSGIFNYQKSTDLLKTNQTNAIKNFESYFYGLNFNYKLRNHNSFFPYRLNLSLSSEIGSRKTKVNTKQQKLVFEGFYSYNLNNKNSLFIQNKSKLLFSKLYLNNELFRIGGLNSIRGFKEESQITSKFSVFNLEYRYLTNNSSYLYTVSDYAYIKNDYTKNEFNLFSLGLGYAFSTKAGIFNLSYVLGKHNKQPFDFNKAVLHIEMVSFF